MYWFTLHSGETLNHVLSTLEDAANEYRATHDTPQADSGWGPRKKKEEDRL